MLTMVQVSPMDIICCYRFVARSQKPQGSHLTETGVGLRYNDRKQEDAHRLIRSRLLMEAYGDKSTVEDVERALEVYEVH